MNEQTKILGIAGTNGSGKDTIAHMLVDKYHFLFVSLADIIRREINKRDLPQTRENLRRVSTEWRRQHGVAVLVDMAYQIFKVQPKGKYSGLVLGSLRNPGEVDRLHDLGGKLIWIDADPRKRYERVHARNRDQDDRKTFEEFLSDEQAEMFSMGDEATLNVSEVRERADLKIDNDFDAKEELFAAVENAVLGKN